MSTFDEFGLRVPEVLLPKDKDLSSWSVIACDQYTQDESYWQKVSEAVGSKPSALNLILPEVYLSASDKDERISKIKSEMKNYLANGVFDNPEKQFIYIERKTEFGRVRHGLIAAVDLENYEWQPMSKALIRATEATIPSRIPPRKQIRNGAALESPHIMLLVNDPEHSLVEETGTLAKQSSPLYDGDLMLGAGHITGWAVSSDKLLGHVHEALCQLKNNNTDKDGKSFLFAVGDGNHSLATAKAVWDEYKSQTGLADSPVRYALVEIVNIYDTGLTFEPIHRVLFDCDVHKLLSHLCSSFDISEQDKVVDVLSETELEEMVKSSRNYFGFVFAGENGRLYYKCLKTNITSLAVSCLQPALDKFLEQNTKSSIDYIHGSDEVFRLGAKEGAVSVLLPPIAKDAFFATIQKTGPLPRKSFSMGEASEKRFYLECRRLFD